MKKPCFAFKVLAAGRITGKGVERAFRAAFDSIKPTDAIYVGMFPRYPDKVRENAEIVQRILVSSQRPIRAGNQPRHKISGYPHMPGPAASPGMCLP